MSAPPEKVILRSLARGLLAFEVVPETRLVKVDTVTEPHASVYIDATKMLSSLKELVTERSVFLQDVKREEFGIGIHSEKEVRRPPFPAHPVYRLIFISDRAGDFVAKDPSEVRAVLHMFGLWATGDGTSRP